jgi:hypothetical protein
VKRYLVVVTIRGGCSTAYDMVRQGMGAHHMTVHLRQDERIVKLPPGHYLVSTDLDAGDVARSAKVAAARTGMPATVVVAHCAELATVSTDPRTEVGLTESQRMPVTTKIPLAKVGLLQRPA